MGNRLTYCFIRIGLVLVAWICCVSPGLADTLEIRDSIPPHRAGIIDNVRVPRDTSFGVLIVATHGVDLTDPDNIRFFIDDEIHLPYTRDLSNDTVRVIKLDDDEDSRAAYFWAVYDRGLETYMPDAYAFDAIVTISAAVRDTHENSLSRAVFDFKIESDADHVAAQENIPETVALDSSDPILEGVYDVGIEVVDGDLAGVKIIYAGSEPLAPRFGPLDEIAPLDADGLEVIGVPINLQPHTVFNTPVRIFIPNPARADLSEVGIYYHDGLQWQQACDSQGHVLDKASGWMQAGSRVAINDGNSALIAVDVHHFSGIQAVMFTSIKGTKDDDKDHSGSHATVFVSCFIDAAGAGTIPELWMFAAAALLLAGFAGLRYGVQRYRVQRLRVQRFKSLPAFGGAEGDQGSGFHEYALGLRFEADMNLAIPKLLNLTLGCRGAVLLLA